MKTYTAEELKEILAQHRLLLDGEGGRRANLYGADLSDANLRGANLRYADLRGANLYGADLSDANLRDANLRNANLYGADLSDANLRDANLRNANLYGANLRYADLRGADLSELGSMQGAVGNMEEVKSIQVDYWPVTYTATHMQIGCQRHTLDEWWAFGDAEITRMDEHAHTWWTVWKPILQNIISAAPAVAMVKP